MEQQQLTDQEKCELVAREFGALVEKHGLVGFFVACAPTHSTHSLLLESAPWVRLKMEDAPDGSLRGIRVISKLDDYIAQGLTKEVAETRRMNEMAYTINALDAIALQAGPVSILMLQLLEILQRKFDFKVQSTRVGDATG
jgi:hypothetical protein